MQWSTYQGTDEDIKNGLLTIRLKGGGIEIINVHAVNKATFTPESKGENTN